RRLRGRVRISGAKNAALPIMAAALVANGPTILHGVPDLVDVTTLGELIASLGVAVTRHGSLAPSAIDVRQPAPEVVDKEFGATHYAGDPQFEDHHVHFPFGVPGAVEDSLTDAAPLRLEVVDERACLADYELVRRMRAGICVLGPLLA